MVTIVIKSVDNDFQVHQLHQLRTEFRCIRKAAQITGVIFSKMNNTGAKAT